MMVSVMKAEKSFVNTYSRKPSYFELAKRLALPVQKIEMLKKCSRDVASMDKSLYQNRGKLVSSKLHVKDRIKSQNESPYLLNEKVSQKIDLQKSLDNLSEREAQILKMRLV